MSLSDSFPPDCLVCRKQHGLSPPPGGPVYEDELVFASHSFIPQDEESVYLGLLFLEPRRHITGLEEMTPEESRQIGVMIARLSRALKAATGAEHIYLFVLGHHVEHLHFWLLPRYPGTPREYWGLRVVEWPDAPYGGPVEIWALCDRLRNALNREP